MNHKARGASTTYTLIVVPFQCKSALSLIPLEIWCHAAPAPEMAFVSRHALSTKQVPTMHGTGFLLVTPETCEARATGGTSARFSTGWAPSGFQIAFGRTISLFDTGLGNIKLGTTPLAAFRLAVFRIGSDHYATQSFIPRPPIELMRAFDGAVFAAPVSSKCISTSRANMINRSHMAIIADMWVSAKYAWMSRKRIIADNPMFNSPGEAT